MFKLHLFGSPILTKNGEHLRIRRKRSMALFAYLALQERPQSREGLATLFWSEYEQSRAFANLRRELARLKSDVGAGLLVSNRQTIGIDSMAELWIDIKHFMIGVENEAPEDLADTLQLYNDDFMAGFTLPDVPQFDEWQYFQADSLRMTLSQALQLHLSAQEKAADYDGAVATARRWLSLDTLHEPAHRSLMRFYALSG